MVVIQMKIFTTLHHHKNVKQNSKINTFRNYQKLGMIMCAGAFHIGRPTFGS